MSNLSRGIGRIIGFQRLASRKSHHAPSSRTSFSTSTSSSTTASSPSILRNPLQWYVSKLDTHPLTTKIITSGLISGSGDLLCQYLTSKRSSSDDESNNDIEKYQPFNWMRTLRFTILGSFLVAPTVHAWYGFLMSSIPGSGVVAIAKRLFCDQGLFAPLFLPTFLSCLTVLEHVTPDGSDDENNNNTHVSDDDDSDLFSRITARLVNDVPDALVVGWSMWIPSMGFMFAFVPGKFQVLFSNGVGFVWNAYLSWKTHEGEEAEGDR
mmetsp:Transcript_27258/g.56823  ORF Transcript_27258/g.56823 Transcript_27258/m.56823 type:complete len:266 (-) Transcript_27258:249-1046(-)